MAPPSAALEHATFDVAGGVRPFTSGASEIDIPQSLMLACLVAFIAYNIFLLDIDVHVIVNFGTTVSQFLLRQVAFVRQHARNARALGFQRTLTRVYTSSRNWLASTYHSSMKAHALRAGLKHMKSNPGEHLGHSILVDAVTVPGAGSLVLIRGLPSDVSAPELRRHLESMLFIQYAPQLNNDRAAENTFDRSVIDDTEDSPIDTSAPGLWRGTCTRSNDDAASTSGIHTPTSEASVSDDSAADDIPSGSSSHEGLAHTSSSSSQRHAHPRCT